MSQLREELPHELKAHRTPVDPRGGGSPQVLHMREELRGAEVPPEPPRGVEGGGNSPGVGWHP